MADFKYVSANSLKVGNLVDIEGFPCKITSLDHSKPGKHGAAKIRIVGVDVFTDRKYNLLLSGGDEAKTPIIERGNAQVVADLGDTFQIMDLQSYETKEAPKPKEDEIISKITNGCEVEYLIDEDKVRIIRVK
jgi:translation initiation factor 5A